MAFLFLKESEQYQTINKNPCEETHTDFYCIGPLALDAGAKNVKHIILKKKAPFDKIKLRSTYRSLVNDWHK